MSISYNGLWKLLIDNNMNKTDLMNEGKSTDAVDDLIIKVGTAPKKKFKVIEKERSGDAR